jgi:hypothetical protein
LCSLSKPSSDNLARKSIPIATAKVTLICVKTKQKVYFGRCLRTQSVDLRQEKGKKLQKETAFVA